MMMENFGGNVRGKKKEELEWYIWTTLFIIKILVW